MKSPVAAGAVARPRNNWIPIKSRFDGWLLFKYDPERDLVEIQRRGVKEVIDLRQLKDGDQ